VNDTIAGSNAVANIANLTGVAIGLRTVVSVFMRFAARIGGLFRPFHRVAPAPARDMGRSNEPARLSPSDQWERLSAALGKAIGSAAQARELQASAAQQIDLATYALYNLVDELAAVMIEPIRRETAMVHQLEPQSARRLPAKALAA
jgi:hypothetical protein